MGSTRLHRWESEQTSLTVSPNSPNAKETFTFALSRWICQQWRLGRQIWSRVWGAQICNCPSPRQQVSDNSITEHIKWRPNLLFSQRYCCKACECCLPLAGKTCRIFWMWYQRLVADFCAQVSSGRSRLWVLCWQREMPVLDHEACLGTWEMRYQYSNGILQTLCMLHVGIFDGHGGDSAADYLRRKFYEAFSSLVSEEDYAGECSPEGALTPFATLFSESTLSLMDILWIFFLCSSLPQFCCFGTLAHTRVSTAIHRGDGATCIYKFPLERERILSGTIPSFND